MTFIASIALLGTMLSAQPLAAPPPLDPIPPDPNMNGYGFGAESDGTPPVKPSRKPVPHSVGGGPAGESFHMQPHICTPVSPTMKLCDVVHGRNQRHGPSPARLAASEWKRMPLPVPDVRTAPPRRDEGLVGVPEWFWVTNWRTVSGRAAAGDVWVEVSARPQYLLIDPGSGQPAVRCDGPGSAYVPSRPARSQRPQCSYTFGRSSAGLPGEAYRVRVTVVWGGRWTASDGSGGVLLPVSRSVTFGLRVAEAQGLYG